MSEEIKKLVDTIPVETQKELLQELQNRHEKKAEPVKLTDKELDMIICKI